MTRTSSNDDPAAPAFGGLPKDPGPAFGRMRDDPPGAGQKTDGANEAGPEPAGDPPLLPTLAKLTREAGKRCSQAAVEYLNESDKGGRSPAPAAIMDTLGMLLQAAAATMDDLADA